MAVGDMTLTTPAEVVSSSSVSLSRRTSCALSANRVAQLYGNTSGQGVLRVGQVNSDNTITWGTASIVVSSNFHTVVNNYSMCAIEETSVAIHYVNISTNQSFILVVPVSGTTVGTPGTAVQTSVTTANYRTAIPDIIQVGLNAVILSFTQITANGIGNYYSVRFANIVGTVPSLTTVRNITGVLEDYDSGSSRLAVLTTTKCILLLNASAGSTKGLCTQYITYYESGISSISISLKQVYPSIASAFSIDSYYNKIVVSYVAGSNIDVVAATVDTSGVLTKGTPVTLSDGSAYSNICSMSNNVFYVSYRGTNPYYFNFKRCTLSGTTITAGSTTTINEVPGGVSAIMISEYKSFISYNIGDSTRNIKYIISNEEKADWAIETYPATNAYPTDTKVTLWKTLAIDDSKFIQVYSTTVSKIAYAVIGTKDSNGDITYGTPVGWSTQLSFPTIVTASAVLLDSTHFVVGLYSATSAWCKYGTISGTSISFGSPYEFKNAASSQINLEKISDTSFLVSFISTTPISRIGTVSSGVISYGTEYAAARTGTITNLVVRRLTSSSFVFTYKDAGLAATQRIMLANISGSTVSYEGATNILADYNTLDNTDILRLDDSSFILGYRNTTSTQYLHVRKCTVSGTTITLGTAYSASGTGTGYLTNLGYIDSTHILITYRDLTTQASSYVIGTLNDYEITFSTIFYDYRVPITKNSSSLITFDNIKFLSTGVDYINTQIAAKLLSINKPVYSASYNGTGSITLSSSFTYEMEEAGKEYTASGTITLSASFDKEVNREKSISGTINLSSSFAYEWQAAQLDVVEVANGDITLSSSFDYFKTDDYIYNGTGTITLSSSFTYLKTDGYEYGVTGAITLSSSFNYFKTDNYNYNGTGTIILSSSFDYYKEISNYLYNALGTIDTSSNFITAGQTGVYYELISPYRNIYKNAHNGLNELPWQYDPVITKLSKNRVGALWFDSGNRLIAKYGTVSGTLSETNIVWGDEQIITNPYSVIRPYGIPNHLKVKYLTDNKFIYTYDILYESVYYYYIGINGMPEIATTEQYHDIIVLNKELCLLMYYGEDTFACVSINYSTNTITKHQGFTHNYVYQGTPTCRRVDDNRGLLLDTDNDKYIAVEVDTSTYNINYKELSGEYGIQGGTYSYTDNKLVSMKYVNGNTYASILNIDGDTVTESPWSIIKLGANYSTFTHFGDEAFTASSGSSCLPGYIIDDKFLISSYVNTSFFTGLYLTGIGYANAVDDLNIYSMWQFPVKSANGTIHISAQSQREIERSKTVSGKIRLSSNFIKKLDNISHVSGLINISSSSVIKTDSLTTASGTIQISSASSYSFEVSSNVYGNITLSSSFDYIWYPDFIIPIEGITIYSSSNILPVFGIDREVSGDITLSSDNIYQVEYIEEVVGQINLSSDFAYSEVNDYYYIANGDITLSSDFTNINNYSYLSNANGLITLSSTEEAYPELLRSISGVITLSSDFDYEEDNFYSYNGTGTITLSSSFTTENNYIYLTDANGIITVISNTYYEANSFEYVLLGTINLSSSPVIENNYNYLTDANGTIATSSIQSTQMDYDRLAEGVITTSSIQSTQMDYDRLAEGVILLSSNIIPVQEDYVYNGSGVITLTSDFDYEEVNEYPYIGSGTILVTGYFPEEVTTYKYDIEGEIQISSNTTYSWLADSKEVIRVESLISKTIITESLQCRKILLRGLVNKKNKLNARL